MSASGTNPSPDLARIVLIRHGESASNAGGWLSGQESCGGLTDLGVAQAEALRARLASDPTIQPDRVMVSTMPRAVHTAEIVAGPTGLEAEQYADLMERTSGEAEGLTIAEYTEKYGKAPWTDWHNPLSPGGESGADFTARVTSALDRVVSEAWGKTIWVVCHGGVIMATAVSRWPGGDTGACREPCEHSADQPDEHVGQRVDRGPRRQLEDGSLQRPDPSGRRELGRSSRPHLTIDRNQSVSDTG